MSINMDGGNETDYSSFEFQQVDWTPVDSGDGRTDYLATIEVLDGIGGLSNNEVAELVYLETQASIEPETENTDQEGANALEHRGVIGANLGVADGITAYGQQETGTIPEGEGFLQTASEDRIFQLFSCRGQAPERNTGSVGGNVNDGVVYEKMFRDLYGRGPVLDSSDDMSIGGSLIAPGTNTDTIQGNVRLHMVWDIAETDDAGRAFSVPMDD